jgi:polyisoprenoid-binding protein YceI
LLLHWYLRLAPLALPMFGKQKKFRANPGFSTPHMGISDVVGNFKKYDAGMHASIADFSDAVFVMSAGVASINTEFTLMRNNRVSGNFAVLQTARVAQPNKVMQRKRRVKGLLNSGLWFWS